MVVPANRNRIFQWKYQDGNKVSWIITVREMDVSETGENNFFETFWEYRLITDNGLTYLIRDITTQYDEPVKLVDILSDLNMFVSDLTIRMVKHAQIVFQN